MSRDVLLEEIEKKQLKTDIPLFKVGDNLKVSIRIIEGDKERIQVFNGTVIARKGSGISETFSMYRVAYGTGMERVFTLHSPRIAKIEVVRKGKVRQAKLYYLRGAFGKSAKVKEKIGSKKGNHKLEKNSETIKKVTKPIESDVRKEQGTDKKLPPEKKGDVQKE